jgi:hypothetical protein
MQILPTSGGMVEALPVPGNERGDFDEFRHRRRYRLPRRGKLGNYRGTAPWMGGEWGSYAMDQQKIEQVEDESMPLTDELSDEALDRDDRLPSASCGWVTCLRCRH